MLGFCLWLELRRVIILLASGLETPVLEFGLLEMVHSEGTLLATGCYDGQARIWKRSGKEHGGKTCFED
ncbi:hypothetical protein MTR67_040515 [Solanum verrucosum]|uniref:Uncharacterized protein n=1 Tax=Solanum verrucosum TaxID=315347 RepID=A0AAF0UJX7_SOLVR|nr:hypothetical protein MTR67_040515 [Solanum verrucosum]